MQIARGPAEELLDIVRVLLLVQGGVLLAATIEALIWSIAFAGATGLTFLLTAAMALTLLVARARLRADRRAAHRLVYIVEGLLIATLGIDTALAIGLTGAVPPPVAILTRFVVPLSVIALLRRAGQPNTAVAPLAAEAAS
jgi:hypothetical protein